LQIYLRGILMYPGGKTWIRRAGSKDYFSKASTYSVTNYHPEKNTGMAKEPETVLDLESRLPEELVKRFDVVFNHTVLEHV